MQDFPYQSLIQQLKAADSIALTTHKSPDGDAIGSILGFYHFLEQSGINGVTLLVPDAIPHFLSWMPGFERITVFQDHSEEGKNILAAASHIVALDYNDWHRMGDLGDAVEEELARRPDIVTILIDHHQQPNPNFTYGLSDTSASSTCELVGRIIRTIEPNFVFNTDISECLYTGIMTDTGSFRFSSTSPSTHRLVADFMDGGLRPEKVHSLIFDQNKYDRLRLVGYAISEKMKLYADYHASSIALTEEEVERYNYEKGDTEGLVNYGLSIRGIRFTAFMRESDGMIKISFRSKGTFDCNQFARKHFHGGGHINAAGGRSDDSLEATLQRFESLLVDYKEELQHD